MVYAGGFVICCMYGTIPLAASFSRYGISDDWLAAFMMSSVLLNPQLIIYSAALGTTALVIRIASCFLCGIMAGLLVRFCYGKNLCFGKDGSFFRFDAFEEPESRDTDSNILLRFIKNLGRNMKATGVYFLFGVVLSALFQRYVPADTMTVIFGGNKDHEPWCAEDCIGRKEFYSLSDLYYGVCVCHRFTGQLICVTLYAFVWQSVNLRILTHMISLHTIKIDFISVLDIHGNFQRCR